MSGEVIPRSSRRVPFRAATHRSRRRASWALRGAAVVAVSVLLPSVAGAQPAPAQSIDELRSKAARLAEELRRLDERTNSLDEDFNDASLRLEGLKIDLAKNHERVEQARADLTATKGEVESVALQAFVGANDRPDTFLAATERTAEESRRRAFLAARYGDRSDVIESLTASQQELAEREAELNAARSHVDQEVAQLDAARAELESTIAERQALQDSVKGELADALRAEQTRLEQAAAAAAQAQARAAAARAAAAQRPQAVVVRTARANAVVATPAPVAPPVAAATPGAQAAIAAALAQQGKPYKWAGVGPNSFDCSGLMMWAYRAAGVSLPHSSRAIRSMTRSISADQLQPGDFVFGGSPVHHVGLYIGNGQMVHAPNSGDVVKVSSMYGTSKPVTFGRL